MALPGLAAGLLVAALTLWWARRGVAGRGRVLLLLAVAAVSYLVAGSAALRDDDPRVPVERLGQRLDALWSELDAAADSAAADLRALAAPELAAASFEILGARATELGDGVTLLLLDPDGVTVGWAGEGLLHEISGPGTAREGRAYRAGFTSVSLAAIRPLDPVARPWRVVAGRSFSSETLPLQGRAIARRWTVFGPDEEIPSGVVPFGSGEFRGGLLAADAGLSGLHGRSGAGGPGSPRARRLAGFALGAGLLLAALGASWWPRFALGLAGLAVWGVAAGVALQDLALLVGSIAYAVLVWSRPPGAARWWRVGVAALAAVGAAAAVSVGRQLASGPLDLAAGVLPGPREAALRLALLGLVVGTLGLARGRAPAGERGELGGWLALVLALGAGAVIDRPAYALALLAGAALLAASRLALAGAPREPSSAGVLLLVAALVAAGSWETVYRYEVREELAGESARRAAPPSPEEREEIARRAWRFFRQFDLSRVALKDPERLDLQDLGLAVWKASDLPNRGWLSAVVVESWDGQRSSFSYGLPIDEEGNLDRSPVLGRRLPPADLLRGSLIEGAEAVDLNGAAWGFVRYWILMRPGFRSARERPDELAEALLRGGPDSLQAPAGVFEPAQLVVESAGGGVNVASWPDGLSRDELVEGRTVRATTATGAAFVHTVASRDRSLRVLVLPVLTPPAALERVATHAAGALLLVLAIAVLALLLNLRAAVAGARLAWRSYTQRLLMIVGALVLLPILALNVLLVRLVAERLEREQLFRGRQALESAGRILGEYVLTLDPGFVIETALDDELLVWLARVARHEVNLYWESSVYASSRRELFTAGLMPKRIPGEIQSQLTRPAVGFAARTNRAGSADYLELYQAVTVPGVQRGEPRLVASMPLLAQQEEVAAEIERVQRRAFLATAALMLLLAAVGARLARGFTKPLMELVRGTQRIADGAGALDLRPHELELATLSDAIDSMAARIALGRQRLLKEKELVERVLDNTTSGVISVDRAGRVLLANQVAQRLLGVAVGESIEEALAVSKRLAPVAAFLRAEPGTPRQGTVRLADEEGEEREWTLVWAPLPGEGEARALLVVEDVTEVLRGQRLEAWAEMARIIAHEIKNPLTPIRLSAEHMRAVRASSPGEFDRVFERCTDNILAQVAELQEISTEFQAYSQIPRFEPAPGDLAELVADVAESYTSAPPAATEVELVIERSGVGASYDARLLSRALRNLIENALRATAGGGKVRIALESDDGWARVSVADDGPGVPERDLGRIFDPYFSTHDTGTGLGLPIARRIAEAHGGTVRAVNRAEGGLEVTIVLPLAAPAGGTPETMR